MQEKVNCDCDGCKDRLPFKLPKEIIDATITGNLVVFAGAGISTESKKVFKETLYEDVLFEIPKQERELDFPSLMSLYCKSHVNGRQKLLQKIKYRFDYSHQFSELYNQASQFHSELSSIYFLKSIITTNWDDFFERECAAIPIVMPEDFAFHDLPARKVFKLHGSISNYGSIIATQEDYARCYRNLNKGIMGSYLKTILATKTVIFVGYSFRDYDFLKIYNYLKKEMKDVLPHSYIVTIDPTASEKLKNPNITLINTDGAFFISTLRKHLEGSKYLFPKENLSYVYTLKSILFDIHSETSDKLLKRKQSNLVYCAFYQDGIKHALDYLIYHSSSGLSFFPDKIMSSIETYSGKIRKGKLRAGNYADVAYIDGYIMGLYSIVLRADDFKDFPFWYLYGLGPTHNKKLFDRAIKRNTIYHKSAEKFGKKIFRKALDQDSEIVFHHRPFIF